MRIFSWIIALLLVTAPIISPEVSAQTIGCNPSIEICNPIQSSTFGDLMSKIAGIAAQIGLPLVVVFMIYAGFLFVSARGNEEQLKKAKTTFFWTIIGALLVVGAYAISEAIKNFAQQL